MTKKEIIAMQPGAELDALIMIEIFKAKCLQFGTWQCDNLYYPPEYSPSMDLVIAWEVMEMTAFDTIWRIVGPPDKYAVGYATGKDGDLICFKRCPKAATIDCDPFLSPVCDTFPEAVCKATLLAQLKG